MKQASFGNSTLALVQGDITTVHADAIVNAANASLAGGGGVDGAIHRVGGPQIMLECRAIGRCPTGGAIMTSAGNLAARFVIHAVAPRFRGHPHDPDLLSSAYSASLKLADEAQARSIAIPSLGTGLYGYPLREAAAIALSTVSGYLRSGSSIKLVTFVLFSANDLAVYESELSTIAARE